mmetsp:Transcript_16457/g.34858  ORF Transcript_16457/g.34858 Transcript_16457/m.34858 type:complete len:215 (-) Transcript_16457:354-998(-)
MNHPVQTFQLIGFQCSKLDTRWLLCQKYVPWSFGNFSFCLVVICIVIDTLSFRFIRVFFRLIFPLAFFRLFPVMRFVSRPFSSSACAISITTYRTTLATILQPSKNLALLQQILQPIRCFLRSFLLQLMMPLHNSLLLHLSLLLPLESFLPLRPLRSLPLLDLLLSQIVQSILLPLLLQSPPFLPFLIDLRPRPPTRQSLVLPGHAVLIPSLFT